MYLTVHIVLNSTFSLHRYSVLYDVSVSSCFPTLVSTTLQISLLNKHGQNLLSFSDHFWILLTSAELVNLQLPPFRLEHMVVPLLIFDGLFVPGLSISPHWCLVKSFGWIILPNLPWTPSRQHKLDYCYACSAWHGFFCFLWGGSFCLLVWFCIFNGKDLLTCRLCVGITVDNEMERFLYFVRWSPPSHWNFFCS